MRVKVRIPNVLLKLTQGEAEVYSTGRDVEALIDDLEKAYPGIKERICDQNGNLRRFVNVFVNQRDIRFLDGIKTELKDEDDVSIIPAIAGGSLP